MTVDYAVYLSDDPLARGSQNLIFDANRNTALIGGSLGMGAATLGAELGSVFGGRHHRCSTPSATEARPRRAVT